MKTQNYRTDPAIIAQTIGRDYQQPKLKAPFFPDALVDFSAPKYVAEALAELSREDEYREEKR